MEKLQIAKPEVEDQRFSEYQFSSISDVLIEITAELGHRVVSFSELLSLGVGSTLQVDRPTGENVDILAANVRIGSGEIIIADSLLAVRIADLTPDESEAKSPE